MKWTSEYEVAAGIFALKIHSPAMRMLQFSSDEEVSRGVEEWVTCDLAAAPP